MHFILKLIWTLPDVCRKDFKKYLDCKIPWADAQEVPKKTAPSVTSVADDDPNGGVATARGGLER